MIASGPHSRMDDDRDDRPDPDALLENLKAEESRAVRARLKIFFGAAPGVGKTYAMLQEARRAHADGDDVVIGVVETHGRAETAALIPGLEVVPRRRFAYRGVEIEGRTLGVWGEPRVNVLLANLALDRQFGRLTE